MVMLPKANLSRSGEILPRPPGAVNNFFSIYTIPPQLSRIPQLWRFYEKVFHFIILYDIMDVDRFFKLPRTNFPKGEKVTQGKRVWEMWIECVDERFSA